ncbi:MAG: chromosome segregation protein SMC, partial [Nitrospirae bacterium]|nr:chromosome segregation protein SMC [Nitrospirota bacterium]
KMEDVIFNGTDNRKPLGMAEVNIILTDVDGQLPAGFGEYKEIQVTRRLYRSGESEYFINRIPCRLKDIRDLLIDSGIGAKTHTIIEQGRMEQILSSKPTDRRTIIEETAGIMKFKIRRNEAINKLEATNQNLLRVNDIVNEVKRQINSIDRQAKKAERYKKLKEEIKDIELKLASKNLTSLEEKRDGLNKELTSKKDEEIKATADIGRIENQIEEGRLLIAEKEREISEIDSKLFELENIIHRNEGRIEMLNGQLNTFKGQIERGSSEIEHIKKEIEQQKYQKTLALKEKEEFESQLKEKEGALKEKEDAFESLLTQQEDIQNSLEDEKAEVFKIITDITNTTNQINNLESMLSETEKREGKRLIENEGLLNEYTKTEERLKNAEKDLSSIREVLNNKRDEYAGTIKEIEGLQIKLKELEERLFSEKDQLSSQNARHASLSDMEKNLTGYQDGVKTILNTKEKASGALTGIHGIVADIIETEPKYELAVEAVLGERLQHIVVETHNDTRKALEYLKQGGSGRGTFIPLELREIKKLSFSKGGQGELSCEGNGDRGIIGPALKLVRYKEGYEKVADYLLGDVLIVEDLNSAIDIWKNDGTCLPNRQVNKTLVTLSGEVVDPWGAVSGGSEKDNGNSLLHRRREIKELEKTVNERKAAVEGLEGRIKEAKALLENAADKKQGLEAVIKDIEIQAVKIERDIQTLTDELKRLGARLDIVNIEKDDIAKEKIKIANEINSLRQNLEILSKQKTEREERVADLQAQYREARTSVEELRDEVMHIKVSVTSLREKNENALLNIHRIEKAIDGLNNQMQKREEDLSQIKRGIEESNRAVSDSEAQINELSSQLNELKKVKTEKIEMLTEETDKLKMVEAEVKQQRRMLEDIHKIISELEVKDTELRLQISHLKEAILENYHTSLEDVRKSLGEFTIDIEEANNNLSTLKAKVEELGPVNLSAIEEYQELTQRYEFLTKQQTDLMQSIDDLQKAISKINRTTKQIFLDTFNTLNESFNQVFKSFFGGGRASLVLVDENNPLESGIEIVAQPTGKRLENIDLLSGGEKALTAISLLFASFLIKPTPFCMLDEIDAPLDEANIGRFTNVLRSMVDKSQFIVITHNKRTMETADALYGVTMEEAGVSKIVSVRFNEETVQRTEEEAMVAG